MAEHTTTTPSGLQIVFEDGEMDPVTEKSKRRSYHVNGQKLPSVTMVLGMLDKPGLMWWSERLAVEGCIELARQGGLPLNPDAALGQLTRNGLRHFQVSEQKADRGHLSHEDLVHMAAGRKLPDLASYPADQQGFIRGVAAFLADYRPTITHSELMVASVEHGFSGRLDALGTLGIRTQPNGLPAPRGLGQLDLKSHDKLPRTKPSKRFPLGQLKTPYPEHLLQVGLYDVAERESGYPPVQWRAIVRVDQEGNYDFTVSWIEPERCLALLPAFTVFKEASARVKQPTDTVPVGLGLEPVAA